jgi:hypothetical protein
VKKTKMQVSREIWESQENAGSSGDQRTGGHKVIKVIKNEEQE